jgi:hypothetical protein
MTRQHADWWRYNLLVALADLSRPDQVNAVVTVCSFSKEWTASGNNYVLRHLRAGLARVHKLQDLHSPCALLLLLGFFKGCRLAFQRFGCRRGADAVNGVRNST